MENNFFLNLDEDFFIAHYGKGHGSNPPGRGSGRYPWGSGAKNGKTPIHEHGEKKHKVTKGNSPSDSTNNAGTPNGSNRVETNVLNNSFNVNKSISSGRSSEAARKAALDSGDRNEIAKYFNESSYGELQQALQKAELKDKLNESLAKAYKETHPEPPQEKIPTAEERRKEYVKQELWSGDLNRIMSVVNDKSINPDELRRAVDKANQIQSLNRQLNPTVVDKVGKAFDTTISAYDKVAPLYNIIASVNNQTNRNTKMPILPVKSNNNQQKQNNQQQNQQKPQQQNNNNQQQNKSKDQLQQDVLNTLKETKESTQKLNQSIQQNNQPQSQPQQQPQQKQQQVNEIMGWLNTDTLKSPQSEKFYQNTIANIVDKPISSQPKTIEFTPQNNNGANNPTEVKWLKMTIDPSVLNRRL